MRRKSHPTHTTSVKRVAVVVVSNRLTIYIFTSTACHSKKAFLLFLHSWILVVVPNQTTAVVKMEPSEAFSSSKKKRKFKLFGSRNKSKEATKEVVAATTHIEAKPSDPSRTTGTPTLGYPSAIPPPSSTGTSKERSQKDTTAAASTSSRISKSTPTDRSEKENHKGKDSSLKKSWLCRTRMFKGMSDWAFDVVDADGSGSVDEKELYSGLLLIHLKLGTYAGPAACKVRTKTK